MVGVAPFHGLRSYMDLKKKQCVRTRIFFYLFDNLPRYNQDILIHTAALRATFMSALHDRRHPQSMRYNKPFPPTLLTSGLLLE